MERFSLPFFGCVQGNVELPEHLPDAMVQGGKLGPKMIGWLIASIASLSESTVFGIVLYFGVLSLPASILGIVGASLYLCR